MKFTTRDGEAERLARRMVYLAWQASRCRGMGYLQDRGDQSEEMVWSAAVGRHDYGGVGGHQPGRVNCDYVYGRMMKLRVEWDADQVMMNDHPWTADYQSFCGTYNTPAALVEAAAKSLGLTYAYIDASAAPTA